MAVADLALVHTAHADLQQGEIVFMKANSKTNAGEPCVVRSEQLTGWVVRQAAFIGINSVNPRFVHWGELVAKKKEVTIKEEETG